MQPPAGKLALVALFGEPGGAEASAGTARLPKALPLAWDPTKRIVSFSCHKLLAEKFTAVFRKIHERGLWPQMKGFGGCYNPRKTKSGKKWSTHAWGIAVDLNPASNADGSEGDMSPEVIACFEEEGFEWGGRWAGKERDPMHFQFATGY